MPRSAARRDGLATLRALARDHAQLRVLLEAFQDWLRRSAERPFVMPYITATKSAWTAATIRTAARRWTGNGLTLRPGLTSGTGG